MRRVAGRAKTGVPAAAAWPLLLRGILLASLRRGRRRMHFRLPRPLHGWRAFAGEVSIIVLGVLIALGLEQAVEQVHDRANAEQARANIRDEIRNDMGTIML